ncbi:MAG: hypothetical protein FJ146_19015 [Deltaproteobacteria bacterium]|nr:hypothetical protein [Deltaproteobacteria bacterium]
MFRILLILFVLLSVGCTGRSHVAAVKSEVSSVVDRIFQSRYYDSYQERACGQNILGFVDALRAAGVDLSDYRMVKITNQGPGSLGMVNAQSARSIRFNRPAAVELNWYHHVILLDQANGLIYDFDYLTGPTTVRVSEYIDTMFSREPECSKPIRDLSTFCVGAQQKLATYLWEISPVTETDRPTELRMGEVLDLFR